MSLPITARGMETRSRLLNALEKVFGERSFYTVSIADITREAGVGQGTFYLYFPSKEAAFRELVQQRAHDLRMATRLATEGIEDRINAERAGFAAFFEFIHQHHHLYRIVRQAEFVDEQVYRNYYETIAEGYVEGLKTAMELGQIRRMDPEVLAWCLMGIGDFLGTRWVIWTGHSMTTEAFEDTMRFIISGIQRDETISGKRGGPET